MNKFTCPNCHRDLDYVYNKSHFWFDLAGIVMICFSWNSLIYLFMACCYWGHRIWKYKFDKNIQAECPHCKATINIPPEQQDIFKGLKKSKFLD